MSFNALDEGSSLLRLEFDARRVVHRRGLLAVLRVVLAAWWDRPRIPADLSPRLRADMGLPPVRPSLFWPEPDEFWPTQPTLWRLGP